MQNHNVSLETIQDFLAQKRIAMVGISRDPASFSVSLFDEFCRRGYEMFPVNPNLPSFGGRHCYANVRDIQPMVDAVILMTAPSITESVVRQCAELGIRRVWMYRAVGQGAVSREAVEFCRAKGIDVVPGQCPFMFWPETDAVHRLHRFFRRITGRYPRRGRPVAV